MGSSDFRKVRKKMIDDIKATGGKKPTIVKYETALKHIEEGTRTGVKQSYDKDDLREILADIEDKEFCRSQNSKRFYYYFLHNLVTNVLNERWPLSKKRYMPNKPDPHEVERNTFSSDLIEDFFIRGAKSVDPELRFFAAVSTLYGVRRVELCFLTVEDVEGDSIYIRTRKGGEPRTHVIPEGVRKYICREFAPNDVYSKPTMTRRFRSLEEAVGLSHRHGFGWHSIRRRLATELHVQDNGLDREDIFDFMRWSRIEDRLDEYTVRTKGEVTSDERAVDKRVFDVHPFLNLWE